MNRRTLFISAFSAAFLPDIARASAPLTFVPQPGLVGSGRLNILTVPVLDVSLFAPLSHWRPDKPYALQVTFLRDLEARRMAGHIRDEMRHTGAGDAGHLELWTRELEAVLPDMRRGDVLTGVRDQGGAVLFFHGDRSLGHIAENGFSEAFFGICLGPRTSQPKLRQAVLGLASPEYQGM
ncbi:chalcone isomerase family protein [Asticcacaulis taihuensis]|uniref:Chalcone isomerase-like n=1 Tax=Asticcacaulis taihuensis TaxID=260084 RepID=A0A1G4RXX8_9CAUL|nr:chalcone isomerase family protein [Asticcacaulis taihuensis]SCW61803.1 Chalcone isomerase-like [Asticcacaulis taihuensis]